MEKNKVIFLILGILVILIFLLAKNQNLYSFSTNNSHIIVYQENADDTTCEGAWEGNGELTYDGNWDSFDYATSHKAITYLTYKKPNWALPNSLWQIKDSNGMLNLTIPSDCWNYTNLVFKAESLYSPVLVNWACHNGTNWTSLRNLTSPGRAIYEEAMLWYCAETCQNLNKQCGIWTICGSSVDCGYCSESYICQNGQCTNTTCISNCTGKVCGDNECGGSCGICLSNQTCQNGFCIDKCEKCIGICVEWWMILVAIGGILLIIIFMRKK